MEASTCACTYISPPCRALLTPTATCSLQRLPGPELLHSVPQAPGFIAHEVAVELAQAELQVWIDIVVPLQEPRHQLVQASQEWHEACWSPAFPVFHAVIIRGQRHRLLQVIPASPADHQRAITVPLRTGIADEALFRHVELAPQPPDVSAFEVSRSIFRGHRDGTDCLASVLAALQLPGALPDCPLGETRGFVA